MDEFSNLTHIFRPAFLLCSYNFSQAFFKDQADIGNILHEIRMEAKSTSTKTVALKHLYKEGYLRRGLILGIVGLQLTSPIWPMIYFSTEFLRRANFSYDLAEQLTSAGLFVRYTDEISFTNQNVLVVLHYLNHGRANCQLRRLMQIRDYLRGFMYK